MSIRFTCVGCQAIYLINNRCAGIVLPCKTCGEDLLVPQTRPAVANTPIQPPIAMVPTTKPHSSIVVSTNTAATPSSVASRHRVPRRNRVWLLLGLLGCGVLATIGVGGLLFVQFGMGRSSKDEVAPNVTYASGGLMDAVYDDGVSPDKPDYSSGDRVTLVGRIESITPDVEYMFEKDMARLDGDDKRLQESRNMKTTFIIHVRVDHRTFHLQMDALKGSDFEALSSRMRGKRVRATGTVTFGGKYVFVGQARITVID
ncbi:MAG TPA: hypothetical protein VHR66_25340 [Gemmataceae bacterium]|jgi:hypothetical protein|nr:hypothetical protein [Gemmataceae bacterium]